MSNIQKVVGNKATRRFHSNKKNDACRVTEILKKNRVYFSNPDEAEEYGYEPCRKCYPKGKTDIL